MAAERVRRVLVVDDEENTRLALTRLLSREGYQVRTASNGNEALCQLRNNPAELIITDLNMPEMNGLTFLRELNREYPMSNVIMITAFGEVESYLEALNLGVFEYLNKPIRLEELKKVMGKISRIHFPNRIQKGETTYETLQHHPACNGFSDTSRKAAEYAMDLARTFEAHLLVLHVINEPVDLRGFYAPHISFEQLERRLRVEQPACWNLSAKSCSVTTAISRPP